MDVEVYDLGEVGAKKPRMECAPKISPGRGRLFVSAPPVSALPAVAASMSLLAPGSGHLVSGEPTAALFFASCLGCVASLGWAIVSGIDRIVPTLRLLDVPPRAAVAALVALLASGCALHVGGVIHAHRLACRSRLCSAPHPIVAGLASAAIPGWGQAVSGHRVRAALFLVALWLLAGAWLAASPLAERVFATTGYSLPVAFREGVGPIALVALSGITWAVAVYDAVAGARAARRR